ncbi:rod shape-determining protein [Streptomyces albiaxialis]|uniref:Cell shape-determining protein MreB n=1 Tax=Streptomyces albiaxialis TaxID=329523 RepID=A0ABP5H549_9ACTN
MSSSLEDLRRCSVAVDLGAARTRVYVKGAGLLVDQPSVVAVNTFSGALIAVGDAAERMDGRTPHHIRVVRPVSGGTVIDIDMAQRMLRALVGEKLRGIARRRALLRAAVTVPHDAGPLARRAAYETLTGVGARRVELVDAPTAAGLGCGLPVEQPEATMILVCGAATTQVAVLSLGSIVAAGTVSLGGDTIHHAVVQYVRNRHELLLPSQAIRPLHLALTGDASGEAAEVLGRDVVTGLARTVLIDPADVRGAIQTPLTGLSDTLRAVLHRCPPDLVADLAERGMVLTGGSALMPGLAERLRDGTGMAVHVADQPELCPVRGLAAMLEGRVGPARLDAKGAAETEEAPEADDAVAAGADDAVAAEAPQSA